MVLRIERCFHECLGKAQETHAAISDPGAAAASAEVMAIIEAGSQLVQVIGDMQLATSGWEQAGEDSFTVRARVDKKYSDYASLTAAGLPVRRKVSYNLFKTCDCKYGYYVSYFTPSDSFEVEYYINLPVRFSSFFVL